MVNMAATLVLLSTKTKISKCNHSARNDNLKMTTFANHILTTLKVYRITKDLTLYTYLVRPLVCGRFSYFIVAQGNCDAGQTLP